jgi:hypothetical protein
MPAEAPGAAGALDRRGCSTEDRAMIGRKLSAWGVLGVLPVLAGLSMGGGCEIDLDDLEDIEIQFLNNAADRIYRDYAPVQRENPLFVELPPDAADRGNTIIINNNVTHVVVIEDQLDPEILPDITLLGFENLTGFDVVLSYFVEGEFQSVLIYADELLLLEYPCLFEIALDIEEDYDPLSGLFVDAFDLSDAFYLNPDEFLCGDAFIISLTPESVIGGPEAIELFDR